MPTDATRLAGYSSAGPNVDYAIKPEIVAAGSDMYVATQSLDPYGDMYNASGYMLVNGTSFSTPMVAGAAALLKSARPGLSVEQYRSLLINNASSVNDILGQPASIQQAGGGALNAWASLNAAVTVSPSTLGFGTGAASPQLSRDLTISNVSTADGAFTISVEPANGDQGPTVATNTLQLAPGASTSLAVSWTGAGLSAGGHEGFIRITGAATGVETRIPYWYDVLSGVPAKVIVLSNVDSGRRGSFQQDALLFRITDSAGVPLTSVTPVVTAVSGGGSVRGISSYDLDVPGVYGVTVRLGSVAGTNVFRIQAGDAWVEASISGQ
ncbi:MAG: S8 family serine peptidase [Acidobacteria bacterium]|nr:S8 family serine peptidase [Acidobacteriota bacterium]